MNPVRIEEWEPGDWPELKLILHLLNVHADSKQEGD